MPEIKRGIHKPFWNDPPWPHLFCNWLHLFLSFGILKSSHAITVWANRPPFFLLIVRPKAFHKITMQWTWVQFSHHSSVSSYHPIRWTAYQLHSQWRHRPLRRTGPIRPFPWWCWRGRSPYPTRLSPTSCTLLFACWSRSCENCTKSLERHQVHFRFCPSSSAAIGD